MKKRYISSVYIACASVVIGIASCGNPIVRDYYDEASRAGDIDMYDIASSGDLDKLKAHPKGTFTVTAREPITLGATVDIAFMGTLRGGGPDTVINLAAGMLFKETKGAVIRDLTLTVNPAKVEGSTVGAAAGTAENTRFVNVHIRPTDKAVWDSDPTLAFQNKSGGAQVNVGGIAGVMDAASSMERCSSTIPQIYCNAGSETYVGGLVGRNGGGPITYSYVHTNVGSTGGEVSGGGGGIAGGNWGAISDSYFAQSGGISGPTFTGGIAGTNSGTIKACYAHGNGTTNSAGDGTQADGYVTGNDAATETKYDASKFSRRVWYFSDLAANGPLGRLISNPDNWSQAADDQPVSGW